MATPILTAERLRQVVSYDPETGLFFRRHSKRTAPLGSPEQGYLRIGIDYQQHLAHRLAWLYVYGEWPTMLIDHINRNRSDNRIANLRDVTAKVNSENRVPFNKNTKYMRGVYWMPSLKKWETRGFDNGKQTYIGRYGDLVSAVAARLRYDREKKRVDVLTC